MPYLIAGSVITERIDTELNPGALQTTPRLINGKRFLAIYVDNSVVQTVHPVVTTPMLVQPGNKISPIVPIGSKTDSTASYYFPLFYKRRSGIAVEGK